jgi:hypothetical protein
MLRLSTSIMAVRAPWSWHLSNLHIGYIHWVLFHYQSAAYLFEYKHHGSEGSLVLAVSSPYLGHVGCVFTTSVAFSHHRPRPWSIDWWSGAHRHGKAMGANAAVPHVWTGDVINILNRGCNHIFDQGMWYKGVRWFEQGMWSHFWTGDVI